MSEITFFDVDKNKIEKTPLRAEIKILDHSTIDKIAAGEVVERPASVVKELVENSMDAGATAITVEIKDGGISFIRVTDNGCGIPKSQVENAFLRHATSKITCVEDLSTILSLGFRGEALSSISAVSRVEMITKTSDQLTGIRVFLEGAIKKDLEEVGAPNGTTILVKNLFFNTPARSKFLKTSQTEGGYISDLLEHLALSRPDISFKYIYQNQVKFHTSGNGNLKEIIYRIYGRDISSELIEINETVDNILIKGFIGNPVITKANRNGENYFINGRYIKSELISKAIEEGYKGFLMQHKYPFCVLHFTLDTRQLDINVHPTKMEVRFSDNLLFFHVVNQVIYNSLHKTELIQEVLFESEAAEKPEIRETFQLKPSNPEPFEEHRIQSMRLNETSEYYAKPTELTEIMQKESINRVIGTIHGTTGSISEKNHANLIKASDYIMVEKSEQMNFFDEKLLEKKTKNDYKILGQIFDTYWLLMLEEKLFIVDQHAAHEKVKYEKLLFNLKNKSILSQNINPPVIMTLSGREESFLLEYMDYFSHMGFEVESFGGNEYAIRAIPNDLFGASPRDLFQDLLGELTEITIKDNVDSVYEKLASMACKSAVKGNMEISAQEFKVLMDQLLELDNPYNCPHGRPTIISMSKYEIEKKFKRVL